MIQGGFLRRKGYVAVTVTAIASDDQGDGSVPRPRRRDVAAAAALKVIGTIQAGELPWASPSRYDGCCQTN
jgi:hypothetical protein